MAARGQNPHKIREKCVQTSFLIFFFHHFLYIK
nr:MAG TPA: hypothetical protein [Caudoviricetes sp.]